MNNNTQIAVACKKVELQELTNYDGSVLLIRSVLIYFNVHTNRHTLTHSITHTFTFTYTLTHTLTHILISLTLALSLSRNMHLRKFEFRHALVSSKLCLKKSSKNADIQKFEGTAYICESHVWSLRTYEN